MLIVSAEKSISLYAAAIVLRIVVFPDDPLVAARELACEIAGHSPDAVRAAKRLLGETWGRPGRHGTR